MHTDGRSDADGIYAGVVSLRHSCRKGVVDQGSGGGQASHLIEEAGVGGIHSQGRPPSHGPAIPIS